MRISDWSSDVCSSDLGLRSDRQGRRYLRGRHSGELQRARQGNAFAWSQCRADQRRSRRRRRLMFFPSPGGRGAQSFEEGLGHEPGTDELHEPRGEAGDRSEEHTSELQSLMRISYAVFCLKKKNKQKGHSHNTILSQKRHTISYTKTCLHHSRHYQTAHT